MEAPHVNGFPVSIYELGLESNLNPNKQNNFNNHHRLWTKRRFGECVLYQTLRDLEINQELVPRDIHTEYHRLYRPPAMPSPDDAMRAVDDAYHNQDKLKIFNKTEYELRPITKALFDRAVGEYLRYR